jgi:hypothetical protein
VPGLLVKRLNEDDRTTEPRAPGFVPGARVSPLLEPANDVEAELGRTGAVDDTVVERQG